VDTTQDGSGRGGAAAHLVRVGAQRDCEGAREPKVGELERAVRGVDEDVLRLQIAARARRCSARDERARAWRERETDGARGRRESERERRSAGARERQNEADGTVSTQEGDAPRSSHSEHQCAHTRGAEPTRIACAPKRATTDGAPSEAAEPSLSAWVPSQSRSTSEAHLASTPCERAPSSALARLEGRTLRIRSPLALSLDRSAGRRVALRCVASRRARTGGRCGGSGTTRGRA
jgi:hypothetical protein